jgi:hypothetical protein
MERRIKSSKDVAGILDTVAERLFKEARDSQ